MFDVRAAKRRSKVFDREAAPAGPAVGGREAWANFRLVRLVPSQRQGVEDFYIIPPIGVMSAAEIEQLVPAGDEAGICATRGIRVVDWRCGCLEVRREVPGRRRERQLLPGVVAEREICCRGKR